MNRAAFFDAVRVRPFGGALSPAQVSGMGAILDEWDRRKLSDPRWLAYMLATTKWETAHTMQPIKEGGNAAYFTRMYDIAGNRPELARKNGNVNAGDGPRYCGRGYVQLTWRNNYRRMGELLGHPLEANPDLAMRPDIAAQVMFEGMIRGSFTGKKLADYFNDTLSDPVHARRIINGMDRAAEIAAIYRDFLAAIEKAKRLAGPPRPADADNVKGGAPKPKPDNTNAKVGGVAAAFAALFAGAVLFVKEHPIEVGIGAAVLIVLLILWLGRKK